MTKQVTTADAILSLIPNAEFIINDGVVNWINPPQSPLTQEQIDEAFKNLSSKIGFNLCKEQAVRFLQLTDWAALTDLNTGSPKLLNQNEFLIYRQTIRSLIVNPIENPTWPAMPTAKWG